MNEHERKWLATARLHEQAPWRYDEDDLLDSLGNLLTLVDRQQETIRQLHAQRADSERKATP